MYPRELHILGGIFPYVALLAGMRYHIYAGNEKAIITTAPPAVTEIT